MQFEQLLNLDATLAQHDAEWRAQGYERARVTLRRARSGTFTARLVWRNRGAMVVSTVSIVVEGIELR